MPKEMNSCICMMPKSLRTTVPAQLTFDLDQTTEIVKGEFDFGVGIIQSVTVSSVIRGNNGST